MCLKRAFLNFRTMEEYNKKQILFKVVSFINREELDFLDKIIKDLYFVTGKKIARSHVIKEIVHVSKDLWLKKQIIQDLKLEISNKKGGEHE